MKGFTGAVKFGVAVLSIFAVLTLFLFWVMPVLSSTPYTKSTYNEFNITYDSYPLYINWTSDIINVTGKVDGLILYVENGSTHILSNYSQNSFYSAGGNYPNLGDSSNYSMCFTDATDGSGMKFSVQNASNGIFSNTSTLDTSNVWILNLSAHSICPPGRYYGYFTVRNLTNSSSYVNNTANVSAIIDIPISKDNTLNSTDFSGFFYGTMPEDYYTYHSYYFNTSEFENTTAVTISLSGFSEDVDLFLFDSDGIIKNASMNPGTQSEKISYMHLPYGEMWEIRVYGTKSTVYKGHIYFSRINASVSSINLGTMDPNQNGTKTNGNSLFRLSNVDNKNVTNVQQITELYRVEKWDNDGRGYDKNNYSIEVLVPSFAEKLMVKIEWAKQSTGNVSNWTLYLYNPSGTLIGSSLDQYISANVTNATAMESVTTTTISEGYWNVTVINGNTSEEQTPSVYNITAYIWFNSSRWIATNFTNGTLIGAAGMGNPTNASCDVNVSINTPQEKLMNGSYEGFLRYTNNSGWVINVPLKFDLKAGFLILNHNISNATATFIIKESIGIDKNRFINISYNNSGAYDIYFNYSHSSFNLTNDESWINFTIDNLPGSTSDRGHIIPAYSSDTIDITLNISQAITHDTQGIYNGWITFNTTLAADDGLNDTTRSYPYGNFNISIKVNLTDELEINITGIKWDSQGGLPYEMENITRNDTFTFKFYVTLPNGTNVTLYSHHNATLIHLNESNMTTHGGHLSNRTYGWSSYNNPICDGNDFCYVNGTLRPNFLGGKYTVRINVSYYTGRVNLTGTGVYNYLIVNNTGLNMSIINNGAGSKNNNIGTIDEGKSKYFNISVTNYGNATARGKLLMGTCSYVTITAYAANDTSGCYWGKSGNYFTLNLGPQKTCWFAWKITASSTHDSNKSCVDSNLISINFTDPSFGNISGVTLIVGNADASSSSGNDGGDDSDDGDSSTTTDRSVSITNYDSLVSIVLGSSGSTNVTVKNTGEVTSAIKLNVSVDGISKTISPTYCNLGVNAECDFEVTLDVYNETNLGNHAGTLRAYVSQYETWYDEESFTVKVLSNPEREAEINDSYINLSATLEGLINEFNALRPTIIGLVSEDNLTFVDNLVNDTNSLITESWNAIASGDYITAEEKLNQVEANIITLNNGITALKLEAETNRSMQQGGLWIWIVIGVIIAGAAGFLIYMLMPPSGYHPKYGYSKESLTKKIKRFFKRKGKVKSIKKSISAKNIKKVFKRKEDPTNYAKTDVKGFYSGRSYEKPSGAGFDYQTKSKIDTLSKKIQSFKKRAVKHLPSKK